VQERGGTNDGEAWSCIDEGRWKEGGYRTEEGGEQIAARRETNEWGMRCETGGER